MDNNIKSNSKRLGGQIDNCVFINVKDPQSGEVRKIAMGHVIADSTWDEGTLLRTSVVLHIDYDKEVFETLNTNYSFKLCHDKDLIQAIKLQCPFQLADS